MKKHLKNIYLLTLTSLLPFEITYADTINFEFDTDIIFYILCILFIIIGISLIAIGKMSNRRTKSFKHDIDPDDHEIVGLKDVEKADHRFDPDSIFKEIPTFSNKKFYETTSEELKKHILKEDKELIEVNFINKNIIDFQVTNKKYIITSEFITEEKKEIETDQYKYIVTSEKNKETKEHKETKSNENKKVTNCPNCGGKIKDPTQKRCLHCGNLLTKETKSQRNWKIIETEKDTYEPKKMD